MREDLFEELLTSVKEARDISKKQLNPSRIVKVEIRDISTPRSKINVSQQEFADLLQISPATLRNWEQGRTVPEGPAQVLLQIADESPETFLKLKRKKKVLYKSNKIKGKGPSYQKRLVSGFSEPIDGFMETLKATRSTKKPSKLKKVASKKGRRGKMALKKKKAAKRRR